MIKANELRIGNLVFAEDEFLHMTTYAKVLWLMPNKILWESVMEVSKGTTQEDLPIDIEPIPITPDILIKCGFEKTGVCNSKYKHIEWEFDYFYIYYDGETYNWERERDEFGSMINGVQIEYLHQLQNLYFSLTNNELNIEGL